MGQSVSKAFKLHGHGTSDGSNMSASSRGLLSAACGHCAGDDLSSKSTASTEDSCQPQQKPGFGGGEAAVKSANAFFGSSPRWSLYRGNQSGHAPQRSRQPPKQVNVVKDLERRTPSRPVPVKGVLRYQLASHEDNFDLWHEGDESDAQYLQRLYEMRTWDMYVRITEARKRQRFGGGRGCVPAVGMGPPVVEVDSQLMEAPLAPIDVPPDHDMIFSCDLE